MIRLEIEHRVIELPEEHQGLATGAYARSALAPVFKEAIEMHVQQTTIVLPLSESTLGRMIVKYSEQVVFQPLREIRHWFTYASGAYIEPGYPPLYYARDRNRPVSPNKSAEAAVGEGVAGFLGQRLYRCRKLARPNHDYPDIVMETEQATYLIEAKATMEDGIDATMDEELPRLAAMTVSASQMDFRPVVGVLVGTSLTAEDLYRCIAVEVRLQ